MNAQLPGDDYLIEVDNGEDALLKKKAGAAGFELTLAGHSVKSVPHNRGRTSWERFHDEQDCTDLK